MCEGMASHVTPTLIGSDITQDFGPRLKSQPPKGHIYVQGCPGRYGITCSLFQMCCMIHIHCLTGVVEVLRYGITPNINLDWIGHYIQEFGPRLKYHPPKGHIYVQGCPGRYGITCSLFQKCFMICRQCLTVMVEVWGSGITCIINLDWIEHYPGILGPN